MNKKELNVSRQPLYGVFPDDIHIISTTIRRAYICICMLDRNAIYLLEYRRIMKDEYFYTVWKKTRNLPSSSLDKCFVKTAYSAFSGYFCVFVESKAL